MHSAEVAFDRVLQAAGCTLPLRDAVDERIVADVRAGHARVIADPSEVGGWPTLAPGTPPADTDHDGMPDAWERQHGFDPTDSRDGPQDADGDGYTNVEEFLNATDPRSPAAAVGGRTARRRTATRNTAVAVQSGA
jgi:hypothetical protein